MLNDLRGGSWNALSVWMRRSKEWRNVVQEANALGLGEIVECRGKVVGKVDVGR